MTREKPLETLKRELWLDRRLSEHGVPSINDATTTTETRKARARDAIEGRGLEAVIAGAPPGDPRAKPLTYAQAFQFVFGESLDRAEAA